MKRPTLRRPGRTTGRNLLFLLAVTTWVAVAPATRAAGPPTSAPPPDLPATARLVADQVTQTSAHPCTGHPEKMCTGTFRVTIYFVPPDTPGYAITKPAMSGTQAQGKSGLASQRSTSSGFHAKLPGRRILVPMSGCTGCGTWNFGCPGTYSEHVQWDEQDYLGVPIYHAALDSRDQTDCHSAWTLWRNADQCSTYAPGWGCVKPIPNGALWDGTFHQDWSNPETKYVVPFPFVCEDDTMYLRTYLSPGGTVKGGAWRSMSYC